MLIRCERSPNGDDVLFISSRHIPGPRRADPSLLCHGPYSHPEDPRPDPHLIPRHAPFLSYKRGGETRGEDGGEAFSPATGTASFEEISLRLFLSDLLTELSGYPADERSTWCLHLLHYRGSQHVESSRSVRMSLTARRGYQVGGKTPTAFKSALSPHARPQTLL